MKKIIALMLVLAAMLSLAACKVNPSDSETESYSPDAFRSQLDAAQAEQSEKAAQSVAAASEVQKEIDEYIAEVGKTEPKKKLVIEVVDWANGRKYYEFEFDKKGNFKSRIIYFFFDTLENYNATVEIEGDKEGRRVIDKDKDMKMVVVKDSDYDGSSFDEMYAAYSREDVKDLGYRIVE